MIKQFLICYIQRRRNMTTILKFSCIMIICLFLLHVAAEKDFSTFFSSSQILFFILYTIIHSDSSHFMVCRTFFLPERRRLHWPVCPKWWYSMVLSECLFLQALQWRGDTACRTTMNVINKDVIMWNYY